MKNREIERRYLEKDWQPLKSLRNKVKSGKVPRYQWTEAVQDAKKRAQGKKTR